MKAIETVYKGYRFRSRLEARWAVFFDALGIKWEYEKEGYELEGIRYLPDFWLPEQRYWIEIKGHEPTDTDNAKCWKLAEQDLETTIFLFGNIPSINQREDIGYKYKVAFNGEQAQRSIEPNQTWTQCFFCKSLEITSEGYVEPFKCQCIHKYYNMDNILEWLKDHSDSSGFISNLVFEKLFYNNDNPLISGAYTSARQARFEFGENDSH